MAIEKMTSIKEKAIMPPSSDFRDLHFFFSPDAQKRRAG